MLQLPPASPQFNPIELAWGGLKHRISNKRPVDQNSLEQAVIDSVAELEERQIRGFITHAAHKVEQLADE